MSQKLCARYTLGVHYRSENTVIGDASTTANHNCAMFCKSRWLLHKGEVLTTAMLNTQALLDV